MSLARIAVLALPVAVALLFMTGRCQEGTALAGKGKTHTVERGETLWEIARSHGCKIQEIKDANKLDQNLIRPGQKLTIPRCGSAGNGGDGGKGKGNGNGKESSADDSSGSYLTHYVMQGESLGRIAKRYDTTVEDIRRRNGLSGTLIRPGQKLRVVVGKGGRGRAIPGQSVGESDNGKLVNGMQLPRGQGYYRRRPERAWGANHTIFHIRRAVSVVHARFPKLHDLAIGDISARKGGKLAQHKSHQSGRDADIGFYFTKRPKGYPESFINGDKNNLHMQATFALLEVFADSAAADSGVEKMFLDYDLQKLFYEWARKHGVKESKLDRMFQYPSGRGTSHGVIRDEPGHKSHVHVRFKCPSGDKACQP